MIETTEYSLFFTAIIQSEDKFLKEGPVTWFTVGSLDAAGFSQHNGGRSTQWLNLDISLEY
jgi:hypothetical protein